MTITIKLVPMFAGLIFSAFVGLQLHERIHYWVAQLFADSDSLSINFDRMWTRGWVAWHRPTQIPDNCARLICIAPLLFGVGLLSLLILSWIIVGPSGSTSTSVSLGVVQGLLIGLIRPSWVDIAGFLEPEWLKGQFQEGDSLPKEADAKEIVLKHFI
jgi:hypothetical protein